MSLLVLPTNKKTHSHKDKKSEASILQMASFSYFQHYPHSLLDPLLFSSPNSSTKLSGFIDQNPLYPPPNISTIVDTSLNPFLDSFNVEKTESSDVKKQINTNATAALTGDQLSPGPSTTSAGKKQRRKTRNGSKSKVKIKSTCNVLSCLGITGRNVNVRVVYKSGRSRGKKMQKAKKW